MRSHRWLFKKTTICPYHVYIYACICICICTCAGSCICTTTTVSFWLHCSFVANTSFDTMHNSSTKFCLSLMWNVFSHSLSKYFSTFGFCTSKWYFALAIAWTRNWSQLPKVGLFRYLFPLKGFDLQSKKHTASYRFKTVVENWS